MYNTASRKSLLVTRFDCTPKKLLNLLKSNKYEPPRKVLKIPFSKHIDPVGKHGFPFILVSQRCTGLHTSDASV